MSEPPEETEPVATTPLRGERRWPMALAVLFLIGLPFLLPDRMTVGVAKWPITAVEVLLLLALIAGDPGRIDRQSGWLRITSIFLVALLVVGAGATTTVLIVQLLDGNTQLDSASTLIATGGLEWIGTMIAFALLFWELDSGGPAARVHRAAKYPDFAFPEQMSPNIAPPDWRPTFVDYFYLSITNSMAFSPTDVMPLKHWAKLSMAFQSLASILILSLVIARAVNILN